MYELQSTFSAIYLNRVLIPKSQLPQESRIDSTYCILYDTAKGWASKFRHKHLQIVNVHVMRNIP